MIDFLVSLLFAVHAALSASTPAAGDTLTAYPPVIQLQFTEPIESEFARITLVHGSGRRMELAPRRDPRNAYALIADFAELEPGGYLLMWRIVSADGHPVGGHFQFYAAVSADGIPAAELLASAPAAPDPPGGEPSGSPIGITGEPPVVASLVRSFASATTLALAGLLTVLTWGLRERRGRLARLEVVLAGTVPLALAADFLLWLQHAAPGGSLGFSSIAASFGTQNGAAYAVRVALSLITAWALLLLRRPGLAAVFALLILVASGATGHPAAIAPSISIPLKIVHLVAASLWLAGLLVLVLTDAEGEQYQAAARRVSQTALVAVAVIGITGLAEAILFLPRLADLVQSPYGLMLLAKMAGLAVLVAFGARHRFTVMPRLAAGGPSVSMRRSVTAESGVMAVVLLIAAFLAYIPPPSTVDALPGVTTDEHGGHEIMEIP